MVKYFRLTVTLFIIMMVSMAMTSCDNSDDIGDLLGVWKLEEVTYKDETTHPSGLFLYFQDQYVTARQSGGHYATGHYTNANGVMQFTFYYTDGTYPDNPASDPNNPAEFLEPYKFYDDDTPQTEENISLGINPVNESFTIEALNSSKMILSNADGRWCFTKY